MTIKDRARELLSTITETEREYFDAHSLGLVNELLTEIERLENENDKAIEIAEANIQAGIANGGKSCHWCMDKVKQETARRCAEMIMNSHLLEVDDFSFTTIEELIAEAIRKEFNL